ncbi:MAG TPA: SCO6880 family protein [Acidimicrobiales bacterium]
MAADDGWRRIRIDDAWHTTYWVASWPRSGRHPAWLEPILSWDGCVDEATAVRRELTVVLEPVAPSVSRRRVDREAIKLESDAAVREEKGRRVDAHHRRAQQAVAEREQELVAGHAELAYAGLLRVTASSVDALERGCDAVEQLAREHGVDLRPLYGRQDLAYTASLPLGLGLGRMVTG